MKLFFKQSLRSSDRDSLLLLQDKRTSVKNVSLNTFCTKSKYEGFWNSIGMYGYGSYYLFYGVAYDGEFEDSMFQARGTLLYPNDAKMDGYWDCGHMIAHRYFFPDNLCYGPYCAMPDRRFYLEIKKSLKPAGRSFLTNSFETRQIPEGCYDTGDGFYNPKMKCVYDAQDPKKIVRIPNKVDQEWIKQHCRKAWDEPVGYKPSIYENWEIEEEAEQHELDRLYRKRLMRKSIDYLSYRTAASD